MRRSPARAAASSRPCARPRAASEDELVAIGAAAARCADRRGRHHGRSQVRLRPRTCRRAQVAAASRASSPSSATSRSERPSSARTRCRRSSPDKRAAYVACVADEMIPALAGEGLIDAVDGFCEGIAFTREEIARVFDAARRAGLPVKLHADQLSNCGGAALAAEFGALSADHLEYTDEAGVAAMAKAGVVAVLLPGAFYLLRERQAPPIDLLRKHRVPMAVATDSNPGTSPLTSLLLALNMAATLFRLTVDECLAGVTRDAARALGLAGETARSKPANGPIWRSGTSSVRPSSSIGSASIRCTRASGGVNDRRSPRRRGVARRLARDLARRAGRRRPLPSCRASAASAAAVERIVARGEPVYGINTGFGKLAGVRIEAADLAPLQRNIVLSHAAGVGEASPVATTRLMMALKLASLAQGASGVRPRTLGLLEAMLDRGLTPVVPAQGSVGASGDLAPLAHMAAAMIGVGDAFVAGACRAGRRRARRGRPRADRAWAQGRAGAAQRHAVLDRLCACRPVRGRNAVPLRSGDGRAVDRRRARLGYAVRPAHPRAEAPSRPDRGRRRVARPAHGQRHSRLASHRRRTGAGPLLPALPAAGDGRVSRSAAAAPPPRSSTEANGVSDNPLIFAEADEALSGGNFHAEPVAFAADIIALAICEIGSLAERRIAMLVDPALSGLAGVPDAEARPQLRVHDPAGDRGGAGRREQAARLSGERRFDPDLGQPGGSRLDGGARRAAAAADGRECRRDRRHRAPGRRPGLRLSLAPLVERAARSAAGAPAPRGASARRRPLLSSGHRGGDAPGPQRRRHRRGRRNRPAAAWRGSRDDGRASRLAHREAGRRAAGGQHSARRRRPRRVRAGVRRSVARAEGRRLVPRRALRLCRAARRDGRAHGALAHGHRRQSRSVRAPRSIPARRRPSLCPTTTFDGEPLYQAGQAPDAAEIDERRRLWFDPYHAALERRDRALAPDVQARRAVRRPFDPLAHPAPVRRRAAAVQSRHQFRGELRSRAAQGGRRGRSRRRATAWSSTGASRAAGSPAPIGEPDEGVHALADGARLPRLHARAGAARARQLAGADRRSARPRRPARRSSACWRRCLAWIADEKP